MISINTGYNIQTRDPIDSRMILSKSEMKEVSDGIIAGTTKTFPENFFCVCKDDALIYAFNKAYKDSDIGRYKQTPEPVRKIVYGFKITDQIYDPAASVEYLSDCDNAGYTPAAMNFETDTFSYGSWKEDEFFMPRPCMLKYDGTVDYYLDPNDYTKKENGEASDVTNVNYAGNAMMEWGRDGNQIWYKVEPVGNNSRSCKVYISNSQIDDGYHAWSFYGKDSSGSYVLKNHFYTSIYNGTNLSSRIRSMSTNTRPASQINGSDMIKFAQNNGDGWSLDTFGDMCLIWYLLVLMGKSISPRHVFGYGNSCGFGKGRASTRDFTKATYCGSMNNKGLFWGRNDDVVGNTNGVKCFGMENLWGNLWHRPLGSINYNGKLYYKMCLGMADGTKINTYGISQTDFINKYISVDYPSVTSGRLVKTMKYHSSGAFFPDETSTEVIAQPETTQGYYRSVYFGAATISSPAMFLIGGCGATNSGTNLSAVSLDFVATNGSEDIGVNISYR